MPNVVLYDDMLRQLAVPADLDARQTSFPAASRGFHDLNLVRQENTSVSGSQMRKRPARARRVDL